MPIPISPFLAFFPAHMSRLGPAVGTTIFVSLLLRHLFNASGFIPLTHGLEENRHLGFLANEVRNV